MMTMMRGVRGRGGLGHDGRMGDEEEETPRATTTQRPNIQEVYSQTRQRRHEAWNTEQDSGHDSVNGGTRNTPSLVVVTNTQPHLCGRRHGRAGGGCQHPTHLTTIWAAAMGRRGLAVRRRWAGKAHMPGTSARETCPKPSHVPNPYLSKISPGARAPRPQTDANCRDFT